MFGVFQKVYTLMGGKLSEPEAMAEYAVTGRMPFGWQAAADGGLEEVRVPLAEVFDHTEGENKLGRGVLSFLSEEEVADFRTLGRREVAFASEFRAPLPARLDFRKFYVEAGVEAAEAAETDLEMLLRWLEVHRNPAKIVFPMGIASVANIDRVAVFNGQRRVIPEIDLNRSRDESLDDDNVDEMGNSRVAASLSMFEGVRKLWIDDTLVGDAGISPLAGRLEALEAIDSNLTDASFPALVRLQSLSCGMERFTGITFRNFAPLTALKELKLEGKGITEGFATLPLSLEKLAVLHAPGLTNAHLARLRVRKLEITRCEAVSDVPPTVQDLTLQSCDGMTRDSLVGRRFETMALYQMPTPLPRIAFARELFLININLGREFDAEGNVTSNLPDCEKLVVGECEAFHIENLRTCRSLRSLHIQDTVTVGFDPDYFFERLRVMCPLLVVLKIDHEGLDRVRGKPSKFGFDLELL